MTGDEKALERGGPVGAGGGRAADRAGRRPRRRRTRAIDVGAGAAGNGSGGSAVGRQFTSPSARRVAREMGVDITTLTGTGPKGRVVRDDVLRAAEAGPAATAPAAAEPQRLLGRTAPPRSGSSAAPRSGRRRPAPARAVPEGWTAVPHNRIRKIIASRLQESKQTAPHFYLRRSAKVDDLLALRAQLNASGTRRSRSTTSS